MKITREEFKEFVELRKEAKEKFEEVTEILNEDFAVELIFHWFDWMEKTLDFLGEGKDMMEDLVSKYTPGIPVNFRQDENGLFTCDYTKDLDVIYDTYVNKEE